MRGIVRISGPDVVRIVATCFDPDDAARWQSLRWPERHPGKLNVAVSQHHPPSTIHHPQPTLHLPADAYLWPGRRSYTGEPLAEIHTVGSPPLLEAILTDLFGAGARPAQPGEFTLRAFLNGRLDLLQAEAVLGVIDARDQQELRTALDQLGGGLSTGIGKLRAELLDLLADLEAGLDFADEHIEFVSHADLVRRVQSGRDGLTVLLDHADRRLTSSARLRVVLAGPPNAGKSTLFNALAGRSAALVSPVAGTTRDYLGADIECAGVAITLIDTAGFETVGEGIMAHAQRLRRDQLNQADLVLWCSPADTDHATMPFDVAVEIPVLHIVTKCDIASPKSVGWTPRPSEYLLQRTDEASMLRVRQQAVSVNHLPVSALTGHGLSELVSAVAARLSQPGVQSQMLGTTAARCRDSLLGACAALDRALEIAQHEVDQSLLAIEIRDALDALGRIVGAIYTDDLLDRIFSRFCIGK
jgi:tRNA modification GTPase